MRVLPIVLVAVVIAWPAFAEDAQPPQRSLRDACAADVRKFCADVEPGRGRIVRCLRESEGSLSDSCKKARSAARRVIERKKAPE